MGFISLSLSIPLAELLGRGGTEPSLATVRLWAPASGAGGSGSGGDVSRAAGLRYWMKDGALVVRMAAAPAYFVLAASLGGETTS